MDRIKNMNNTENITRSAARPVEVEEAAERMRVRLAVDCWLLSDMEKADLRVLINAAKPDEPIAADVDVCICGHGGEVHYTDENGITECESDPVGCECKEYRPITPPTGEKR